MLVEYINPFINQLSYLALFQYQYISSRARRKPRLSPSRSSTMSPKFELTKPALKENSSTVSTEIGQHFVEEFHLNEEQTLAFRIIANHSIGQSKFGDQLRMGIFGEGGTGKSRLIMAIRAWFCRLGRSERLLLPALRPLRSMGLRFTVVSGFVLKRVIMAVKKLLTRTNEELHGLIDNTSSLTKSV